MFSEMNRNLGNISRYLCFSHRYFIQTAILKNVPKPTEVSNTKGNWYVSFPDGEAQRRFIIASDAGEEVSSLRDLYSKLEDYSFLDEPPVISDNFCVAAAYIYGLTEFSGHLVMSLDTGDYKMIEDSVIISKTEEYLFENFYNKEVMFSELTAFENRGKTSLFQFRLDGYEKNLNIHVMAELAHDANSTDSIRIIMAETKSVTDYNYPINFPDNI